MTNAQLAVRHNTSVNAVKHYKRFVRYGEQGFRKVSEPGRYKKRPKETAKCQVIDITDRLHKVLKSREKVEIITLADQFEVAPKVVMSALDNMEARHITVQRSNGFVWIGEPAPGGSSIAPEDSVVMDPYLGGGKIIKFGLTSDNHMGSRYERMDVLNACYDAFAAEGITTVYNCGNYIDGDARFNRHDLNHHGIGNQFHHFMAKFPRRDGMTTYFISGDDHEGWYVQREGVNL